MPEETKPTMIKKADKKSITELIEGALGDQKSGDRFIILMIAAIFLVVVGAVFALSYQVRIFVKQSNTNKAQFETINLLEKKKKDLAELRPNYEALNKPSVNGKSEADLILNAVPTSEAYGSLIAMIERMGQESGVKISSVPKSGSASAPAAAGISSYSINVPIDGEYNQILDFIKKTENSSRVLNFTNISFSSLSRNGKITASTTFNTYFKPPADIKSTQKELK